MNFNKTLSAGTKACILIAAAIALSGCDAQSGGEEQSQTSAPKTIAPPTTALAVPPTIVRATFPDSAGKTFFEEQVLPELYKNGCPTCHMPGDGYVRPAISYDGLFPFLAIGQAADNNIIMFKIANQRSFDTDHPNHPGGKRCSTEDAEPCKSIKDWWESEFGSEAK